MAESRSIEVKVGMLILIGLGLLAALVLIMGRITFQKRFTLYVDFENPGAIQPGAAVKIAGVRVGTVDELEFRASPPDPLTGRRTLVRAKISVEERYHKEIHTNSDFYVTTLGILGEQFLAIDPGATGEIIPEGKVVIGQGPPRIDLFVARAYTLLDDTVTAIQSNRETIHNIVQDLAGVLRNTNQILARNGGRVDTLLADADKVLNNVDSTLNSARNRFVNNPQVDRIFERVEHAIGTADRMASTLERDVPGVVRDVRQTTAQANRVLSGIGEQQLDDVRASLRNVRRLSEQANGLATDAQHLVAHVQQGRGTIGALLMDEELYDDLQELVRDLKHNPWKFFWRE